MWYDSLAFENPMFLIPAMTGPAAILGALLSARWPAKRINHLYGYRTKKSMSSQEIWDFAQRYYPEVMLKLGFILTFCSLPGLFMNNMNQTLASISGLAFSVILVLLLIYSTDKKLDNKFLK